MSVDEIIEKFRLEISVAVVGMILVGAGLAWWRVEGVGQPKVEILSAQSESSEKSGMSGKIVVDVGGAVARPGVYELDRGVRVSGALEAAGGISIDADQEWIEKYLNRSEVVRDGQKIYIPNKTNKTDETNETNVSNKININTAGQSELEGLPGVGPVTAGKIIAGRPYGRIEELLEKKIVGQKVWEQIKESVSLW